MCSSDLKLFFGGEGEIAENLRHEQRKVIKYNHLVANMVILHNVVGMSRVLNGYGRHTCKNRT